MSARTGRKFTVLVVAALVAAGLSGVSSPPAGADHPCPEPPTPVNGHWTGGGLIAGGGSFTLDNQHTFIGTTMTGTTSVNGDAPSPLTGELDCELIEFGSVGFGATFTGTIAPDGRSMAGSFEFGASTGIWELSADQYELVATSTAQPTTIAPGAASSWVLDVQNIGSSPTPAHTQTSMSISGAGKFGPLSQSSTSQGTGCSLDPDTMAVVYCDLGLLLPGQKESATIVVVATGGAGTSMTLNGAAFTTTFGAGTDDTANPVTVSVVAPANLPPGTVSGVAKPGVSFETPNKQATPQIPIAVKFKLPKKVSKASTLLTAGSRRPGARRASTGIALMSTKSAAVKRRPAALPRAASVKGPAVPMSISRSSAERTTFCGGAACSGDVLHLTSFAGYKDKKKPAKLTITWDAINKGRGVNSVIYKRGDSVTSPTKVLPQCIKTAVGWINTPCISKRKQAASGDVTFTLLVLSGDPKFGRR